MENEYNDDLDISTQEDGIESNDTQDDVDVEELQNRLAELENAKKKSDELANNYKIRAEKAERQHKSVQPQKEAVQTTNSGLSQTDLIAVIKSNIAEEDLPDIQDYANMKGISVSEAIKTGFVKNLLADKEEQRNGVLAMNVGTPRKASLKTSDDVLLANARKGIFPDNDEDIARLATIKRK